MSETPRDAASAPSSPRNSGSSSAWTHSTTKSGPRPASVQLVSSRKSLSLTGSSVISAISPPVVSAPSSSSSSASSSSSSSSSPASSKPSTPTPTPELRRHERNRKIATTIIETEGYLHKTAGNQKAPGGWQRRFFKFETSQLKYFKPTNTDKEAGHIDLQNVTEVSALDGHSDTDKGRFVFQVVTPLRTYFLYTEDEQSRENWIASIQTKAALSRISTLKQGGKCLQGYLWKEPGKIVVGNSAKQKRLFALEGSFVSYFKNQAGKPAGMIDLSLVTQIIKCRFDHSSQKMCKFKLCVPGRNYKLYAVTEEERGLWVEAFENNILSCCKRNVEIIEKTYSRSSSRLSSLDSFSAPSPQSRASVASFSSSSSSASLLSQQDASSPAPSSSPASSSTAPSPRSERSSGSAILSAPASSSSSSSSSSFGDDAEETISEENGNITGFLQKAPGIVVVGPARYQRRWFILTDDLLCYYKQRDSSKPSGAVDLSKIESVEVDDARSKKNSFFVAVPGRKYHFVAATENERQKWIDSIKKRTSGPAEPAGDSKEDTVPEAEKYISKSPFDPNFLQLSSEAMDEVLTCKLNVGVLRAFFMFFSDEATGFKEAYGKFRNDTELNYGLWTKHEKFGSYRENKYRTPVTAAFGPKSTMVHEKQRYHLQNDKMTFEFINSIQDIPFGDSFQVEGRWEIKSCGTNQVQIVARCGCNFIKPPNRFIKGQIVSGTIKETKASYQGWLKLARDLAKTLPSSSGSNENPQEDEEVGTRSTGALDDQKKSLIANLTTPHIIAISSALVLLLSLIIFFLFF